MIQNNHPSEQLTKLQKKVEGLERKIRDLEASLSVPRPKEKLLNTAEACMYLDVGRTSLYRYMDEGLLAYTMVGKQRRFALKAEREGFEPNAPICSISVIYKNSFR